MTRFDPRAITFRRLISFGVLPAQLMQAETVPQYIYSLMGGRKRPTRQRHRGLEWHVTQTGHQRAPRVMLYVAGNGDDISASECANQFKAWGQQLGADTAAFNYRGVAGSQGHASSLDDLARDTETMIEHLVDLGYKRDNILIFAHSLGGAAATLATARQYQKYSDGPKLWNVTSFSRVSLAALGIIRPNGSPLLEPTFDLFLALAGWNDDIAAAWHIIPEHAKGLVVARPSKAKRQAIQEKNLWQGSGEDGVISHEASLYRALKRRPHANTLKNLPGELLAIPLSLLLLVLFYGLALIISPIQGALMGWEQCRNSRAKPLAMALGALLMPLVAILGLALSLVEWTLRVSWRLITLPYRSCTDALNLGRAKEDTSTWRRKVALGMGTALSASALTYASHTLMTILPIQILGSSALLWTLLAVGWSAITALILLHAQRQPEPSLLSMKNHQNKLIGRFEDRNLRAGHLHCEPPAYICNKALRALHPNMPEPRFCPFCYLPFRDLPVRDAGDKDLYTFVHEGSRILLGMHPGK